MCWPHCAYRAALRHCPSAAIQDRHISLPGGQTLVARAGAESQYVLLSRTLGGLGWPYSRPQTVSTAWSKKRSTVVQPQALLRLRPCFTVLVSVLLSARPRHGIHINKLLFSLASPSHGASS